MTLYEMISMLKNNDGLTLKKYQTVTYKTGYQVADYGVECYTVEDAVQAIINYQGDCGVWYAEGIYYIDHSFRTNTKRDALAIGRAHNQISVLQWATMKLIYC